MLSQLLIITTLCGLAHTDVYLQNPRGSNNRLNENGRERANGNRLFDSQNNNRGGYNVGSLYYYPGSILAIEWTNQHSCSAENSHCELILQYMCHDNLRDGTTTTAIPDNRAKCKNYDCDKDVRYGMHEDYASYVNCKERSRNKGLFVADQKLKGHSAIYTRQNPNGQRRGYECPEERDYYPYWQPSQWKDIAVLTTDVNRCEYYQTESQNVKSTFSCVPPKGFKPIGNILIPNNKEDCEKLRYPSNAVNGSRGVWTERESHNLDPPECIYAPWSRDNHLGNGKGGFMNTFNWTIPDAPHENCAIRMRYNISTGDYDAWNANMTGKVDKQLSMTSQSGLSDDEEARSRGYLLKNNPQVETLKGFEDKFKLQLAVNTAQFGRVFQDRSHSFAIRTRPDSLAQSPIYNVNVRGKRGNIVQVYPAVEYDFVPNRLELSSGDQVHFQWTGSNNNPNNNDGQGRAGSDRSNVAAIVDRAFSEGSSSVEGMIGHWGRNFPVHLDQNKLLGFSALDLTNLAVLSPGQFRGDLNELDDAGTYFDMGARRVTSVGTHQYMCTRNNNFSNRSQKGRIIVIETAATQRQIGWSGGSIQKGDDGVVIGKGVVKENVMLRMESWDHDGAEKYMKTTGGSVAMDDEYSSDFLVVYPMEEFTKPDKKVTVKMKVDTSGTNDKFIYRSINGGRSWKKMDAKLSDGVAEFQTSRGGMFVAREVTSHSVVIGAVLAVVILVILAAGVAVYCWRRPGAATRFRAGIRYCHQSVQQQV